MYILRRCGIFFVWQSKNVELDIKKATSSTNDKCHLKKIAKYYRVSFKIKLKIIMTANENPKWSFKYLQKWFKQHLHHNSIIARFKKEILRGGSFLDKIGIIKKNIHDRFTEAREQKQLVTRRQQWAIAAAVPFRNMENENECAFCFVASPR